MKKILKHLEAKKYPIVHASGNNKFCLSCFETTNEHCTHYLVVTKYIKESDMIYVRLITNSECCGNKDINGYEYCVYINKFLRSATHISDTDFLMESTCIANSDILGYFTEL